MLNLQKFNCVQLLIFPMDLNWPAHTSLNTFIPLNKIFDFLNFLSFQWYPESARYFLVSNQYDKANKLLQKMSDMNGKDLPPGKLVHVSECNKRGRIQDLLNKDYRKATLLFWYIW